MTVYRICILCFVFLFATPGVFAQGSNAGIVKGLWFDRESFFVGDTVRVYAAVRNNTGADLSGTVEFYVNDERIERANIDALNGRIVETWGDWTPSYGTSTISATLSRTEISSTASGTQAVTVTSALAEAVVFIDRDTDGDLRGDAVDDDDDGDGIPDEDDARPLQFDEPEPKVSEIDEEGEAESAKPTKETTDPETPPTNTSIGLEQYLTDDTRLDETLSNITTRINSTKRNLDGYRQSRDTKAPTKTSSSSPTESLASTSAEGFGEITRSSPAATNLETNDWLGKNLRSVGNVLRIIYDALLGIISFILSYPILVQLLLLIAILYSIYKIAKKFGSRPE